MQIISMLKVLKVLVRYERLYGSSSGLVCTTPIDFFNSYILMVSKLKRNDAHKDANRSSMRCGISVFFNSSALKSRIYALLDFGRILLTRLLLLIIFE